ncbi:MAG: DUF4412 domain-containing protein [Chitinophagales bacterium]|nr:DUF4412 domain-containing protein [Chitinophagales bacterium]
MKIFRLIPLTFFFAFFLGQQADAQFLKKLGNSVGKRLEDKIINDATNTSERAVDKAEKETGEAVKSDKKSKNEDKYKEDETPFSLDDFINTSSSSSVSIEELKDDYTIQVTGSGSDLLITYQAQMSTAQNADFAMDMHIKMYVNPDIGSRAETNMNIPFLGSVSTSTITLFDSLDEVILLNEKDKSYSIISAKDAEDKDFLKDYTVTVVGTEKLLGLNCTHVKVSNKKEKQSFEIWTSKDIPGYEKMNEIYGKNSQMGNDVMWQALKDKGADGFMVKLYFNTKDATSVMQLKDVQKTNVPNNLLEIPSDYKKVKNAIANPLMR